MEDDYVRKMSDEVKVGTDMTALIRQGLITLLEEY